MGEWHEVKMTLYKKGGCPCNNCQGATVSISQKTENGKFYEKFGFCQETCDRFLDWLASWSTLKTE